MTDQDLPAPVARAIDAINADDTDAFLSEFSADGWIDDNGPGTTPCAAGATAS